MEPSIYYKSGANFYSAFNSLTFQGFTTLNRPSFLGITFLGTIWDNIIFLNVDTIFAIKLVNAVNCTWIWISLFSRSKVTKEYLIRAVNVLFSLRAYDAWRMHCLCWTLCISTWHVVYVVLTLNAVDIPSAKVFINVFIFLNYTSKSLKRTLTLQI